MIEGAWIKSGGSDRCCKIIFIIIRFRRGGRGGSPLAVFPALLAPWSRSSYNQWACGPLGLRNGCALAIARAASAGLGNGQCH